MKFDLTRLPVIELVVVFFIIFLALTFFVAFRVTDDLVLDVAPAPDPAEPIDVPPPLANVIPVDMGDNFFDPDRILVPAGQQVTFELDNIGAAIHNMQIADEDGTYPLDVCEVDGPSPCSNPNIVPGGQSASLVWDVPNTPGEERLFRCDFHIVEMTGVIVISETD
jgi:plastocyanin